MYLQEINKLVDGVNIKSITTDSESEFYAQMKFKGSINNHNNDINVYFHYSYYA